ncbi:MAG: hypothetical protein JWN44_1450 [Myxococcales bacterium]|nr:hypothetical protein [Myxococcales bacterium]
MRQGTLERHLRSLPVSTVFDLREGALVKLVGAIAPGAGTVEAPYTGRAAVAYSVRLAMGDPNQPSSVRAAAAGNFDLQLAAGGTVHVRGSEVELIVGGGDERAVARQGERAMRETLLQVGDEVIVIGKVRRDVDSKGQSSYREPPTRLVVAAPVWIVTAFSGRR